ncbi:hypothetical protein BGZ94_001162 [Podila epigama]|nr:hypothetical protein BGZ94_001162 [Podila epigama]
MASGRTISATPTMQKFASYNGVPIQSIQTCFCERTRTRYILWSDIQKTFKDMSHLTSPWNERTRFLVDEDHELIYPLRIGYFNWPLRVILYETEDLDNTKPTLDCLFKNYKAWCQELKIKILDDRADFLTAEANLRLHHAQLVSELEQQKVLLSTLKEETALAQKTSIQEIKAELAKFERKQSEDDHENNCFDLMGTHFWQYAAPSHFLVLVQNQVLLNRNLDKRMGGDMADIKFQLYFLCAVVKDKDEDEDDNKNNTGSLSATHLHRHVHLVNHHGYTINHPRKFFEIFGDYCLKMLMMVNHGSSSRSFEVPTLDSMDILWNCDFRTTSLDKKNFEARVDRTIAYIQALPLQKRSSRSSILQKEDAILDEHLDWKKGDNKVGNMSRYAKVDGRVIWGCSEHTIQFSSIEALYDLGIFVRQHGGSIDIHRSRIEIELKSMEHGFSLFSYMKKIRHVFDIALRVGWAIDWKDAIQLVLQASKTTARSVEVDGLTPETISLHRVVSECMIFMKMNDASKDTLMLDFVTFVNFPRPEEQYTVFQNFGFKCGLPGKKRASSQQPLIQPQDYQRWARLILKVIKFHAFAVSHIWSMSDMSSLVDNHRQWAADAPSLGIQTIDYDVRAWQWTYEVEQQAITTLRIRNPDIPNILTTCTTLRHIYITISDPDVSKKLGEVVQRNPNLRELQMMGVETHVLEWIDRIWQKRTGTHASCRFMFYEQLLGPSRMIAEVVLLSKHEQRQNSLAGESAELEQDKKVVIMNRNSNATNASPDKVVDVTWEQDLDFLRWECDHISSATTDNDMVILDMATLHHPYTLTSLTMDTLMLGEKGLESLENVLGRSCLEHLHISCYPITTKQRQSAITQVLQSIHWPTIKSLVLSGSSFNTWLACLSMGKDTGTKGTGGRRASEARGGGGEVRGSTIGLSPLSDTSLRDIPGLLQFQITGSRSLPERLLHSSALILHALISFSPLKELHFKNVEFDDERDWCLIVDVINDTMLDITHVSPSELLAEAV